MARTKTKKPPVSKVADPSDLVETGAAPDSEEQMPVPTQLTKVNGMTLTDYTVLLDDQITESKDFWNKNKDYQLEHNTKENEKWYLGRQVSDIDDGEEENLSLDNRIFTSVRTIIPYTMTRLTEPEVYPSSNSTAAKKFAEDFAKALHIKGDKEKARAKFKFALEDAIVRRRGYLKPRYDMATGNWFALEYIPCESIIIDHNHKPYEEPRYFRHCQDKSAEDLILMFPDQEAKIKDTFKILPNSPAKAMKEMHEINEDWAFVVEDGQLDLIVTWNFKKVPFGCIKDPNWRYGHDNFLDSHMMPLIFLNVLNDGRRHIDKTSYVEQTKYSQATIDKRGKQIGDNAGLGNIGMPVVDAAALADDQAEFVRFEPDTVLELDIKNANGNNVSDAFTTWKAGTLSPDVYRDKTDAIESVQNTFAANNVMQGQSTENDTLGQDELLRDNSMGRLQEILDAIDIGAARMYLLMAQFLLIYGDDEELFKLLGENGQFDYIVMNTDSLDTNAEIRVKAGTSMPIDNPQRRATADKAASQLMIDPLSYWEIMDQPNAQKYAKRLMDFKADPASFLKDTQEELFNRDAYVDLELIKRGATPPYRDDLDKEYFDYLNQYVLSGDLENPNIPLPVRQQISQFIDQQLVRAQKMLGMAETQLPTAQDVNTHNAQVDQANAANAASMKGMPPAAQQPQQAAAPLQGAPIQQPAPQVVQ